MRKKQLKNRTIAVAAIFFVCTVNISAQVNIGTIDPPHAAAVLDLSQKEAAAPYRGLLLPRVSLTDPDDFQLIADADDTQKSEAAGMVVYNFSQCDGKFAKGVYAWTGTKWVQLTNNPVLNVSNPTLTFDPVLPANNFIEIPSGQDARTPWASAYKPEISYTNASSVTGTWANTIPNASNGLVFGTQALAPAELSSSPYTYTWSASPISNISVWPDAMTDAEVTTNRFLSRESKLTITGIAGGGPCPGGSDQTVIVTLNQTNYSIVPSTSTSEASTNPTPAIFFIALRNMDAANLPIHSNVSWKATTTAGSAQLAKVLTSNDLTNATVNGGDKSDGTKYTPLSGSSFDYQSVEVAANDLFRYETVDVTFEDANASQRAQDATVTFMQCQGMPNMSSVTPATPTETSGANNWGDAVVKHAPKYVNGTDATGGTIYEEFYSADFGAAGRWMTTNLAARFYDTNVSQTLNTLPSPTNVTTLSWCYPGEDLTGGTNTTEYIKNPHVGLLYNWYAATGLPNNTNSTDQGNSDHTQIQGICPNGWHLPSDKEWTALENAIIESTTNHAYVSTNISPDGTTGLLTGDETSWRGTTHGQAMKDVCGVNNTDPNGLSKKPANNGFNVLLTGFASVGDMYQFGTSAYLWSSSSHSYDSYFKDYNSWMRRLTVNNTTTPANDAKVNRTGASRYEHRSVRCKKD